MSRALYIVYMSRESWWVDFEGEAHGPHSTVQEAALAGLELAKMTAHSGRRAELRAPDAHGGYAVIWDSDREARYAHRDDTYPAG